MQTITSAYANKMLKSLEEDKAFWVNKEAASSTYVAAINEEPVIPEYDYSEVASMITAIDEKIAIIKHALNVTNATAKVQVGNSEMSIDTILIKMAQLNKRKGVLDQMRKQLPKSRQEQHSYTSRNTFRTGHLEIDNGSRSFCSELKCICYKLFVIGFMFKEKIKRM